MLILFNKSKEYLCRSLDIFLTYRFIKNRYINDQIKKKVKFKTDNFIHVTVMTIIVTKDSAAVFPTN